MSSTKGSPEPQNSNGAQEISAIMQTTANEVDATEGTLPDTPVLPSKPVNLPKTTNFDEASPNGGQPTANADDTDLNEPFVPDGSFAPRLKVEGPAVKNSLGIREVGPTIDLTCNSGDDVKIKKEDVVDLTFDWTTMPSHIDLSDWEEDHTLTGTVETSSRPTTNSAEPLPTVATTTPVPNVEASGVPFGDSGRAPLNDQPLDVGRSMFTCKGKAKRTPEEIARMKAKVLDRGQKMWASSNNSIFRGSSESSSSNTSKANLPSSSNAQNPWMDLDEVPDSEAARNFEDIKKAHRLKRQTRTCTFEDEVMWGKAQGAERSRRRSLATATEDLGPIELR